MKTKILFTTHEKIPNEILYNSFKEFFDLLYDLPGANKKRVCSALAYLVFAAANRASLTFAGENLEEMLFYFMPTSGIIINAGKDLLLPLYEVSAFLKNLEISKVENAINRALARQVMLARRYEWIDDFNMIITDAHEIPAWCKKHRELIVPIAPRKKSSSEGFRFYTAVTGDGRFWLTYYFAIDGSKDSEYIISKADVVRNAIKSASRLKLSIEYSLFDSGFFEASVLETIARASVPYLMIARKTKRVKEAVLEGHRTLNYHYGPMVEPLKISSKKYGSVSYNLVTVPRPPEKRIKKKTNTSTDIVENYVTLATNMSYSGGIGDMERVVSRSKSNVIEAIKRWAVELAELKYRKRQNIENTYKLQELGRGRTNSRNMAIRVFLFGLMAVLYNIYALMKMYENYGVRQRNGNIKYLSWDRDVRMWRVLKFTKNAFVVLLVRAFSNEEVRLAGTRTRREGKKFKPPPFLLLPVRESVEK